MHRFRDLLFSPVSEGQIDLTCPHMCCYYNWKGCSVDRNCRILSGRRSGGSTEPKGPWCSSLEHWIKGPNPIARQWGLTLPRDGQWAELPTTPRTLWNSSLSAGCIWGKPWLYNSFSFWAALKTRQRFNGDWNLRLVWFRGALLIPPNECLFVDIHLASVYVFETCTLVLGTSFKKKQNYFHWNRVTCD